MRNVLQHCQSAKKLPRIVTAAHLESTTHQVLEAKLVKIVPRDGKMLAALVSNVCQVNLKMYQEHLLAKHAFPANFKTNISKKNASHVKQEGSLI